MVKTQLLHACGLLGLVLCSSGLAPEVHEVSMLRLNNIEFEVGDELPDWVLALDGETVQLSGYMQSETLEGESWFDLTNDSCGCGTSKLQHFVRVIIEDGTTTFTPSELELEGVFSAGEEFDEDEFIESIFRLTIDSL
ncbi:MAG: hypothetical protein ABGY71_02200 [bacterium]|jgi:hypothetical protein|nr:hypothetical protein [Planctomycetota bacterium]HIL52189.1 hypothetical protein [Planctomycetota bacterium]